MPLHHCTDHNAVEGETRLLTPESVLSTYELALRDPVINTGASANSSPFAWQESFWAGGRLKCPTFDQITSGNYFFHAQPKTLLTLSHLGNYLRCHVSSAQGSDRVPRDPKQMAADELPGDEVVEM